MPSNDATPSSESKINHLQSEERTLYPRIYGANELGVLSLTAPGEGHPRVAYVGGELFVGLDDADNVAVTQGQAEAWSQQFREVLIAAVSPAAMPPEPVEGVILIEEEGVAASVLVDPSRIATAAVTGGPVLFALSRDRIAVVGADDGAAAARVLNLAEELYEAGGPLVSAHPVILASGAWLPFPWGERFESQRMRFERVMRLFGVRSYEAQTVALGRVS